MAQIRIKALDRLADLISCEVKELKGSICAGPAGRDHRLAYPSLSINPLRFSFNPDQADERDPVQTSAQGEYSFYPTSVSKQTIFNVGRWEGTVELRLGAKTAARRYDLEHKIEQIFLAGVSSFTAGLVDPAGVCARPGIVLIDVPECYGARIAFELEDDTWDNEKVFNKQWYSVMRITAQIPALVLKSSINTIETLNLTITQDLDTVATPTSLPPGSETVTIAEDGTIS